MRRGKRRREDDGRGVWIQVARGGREGGDEGRGAWSTLGFHAIVGTCICICVPSVAPSVWGNPALPLPAAAPPEAAAAASAPSRSPCQAANGHSLAIQPSLHLQGRPNPVSHVV